MEKNLLFSFIRQPDQMTAEHNQVLKDTISDYPYFHSAHLLLLYNLKKISEDQYNQQLRKSALFVSDRQILFNLLYGFNSEFEEPESETPSVNAEIQIEKEKTSPLLDRKDDSLELLEIDEDQTVITNELEQKSSGRSGNISTYQIPDFELDEESNSSSSFDLIEKFIEENPAFVPNRLDLSDTREDISISSVIENEDLVTETLAMVYTNQKLYAKAISIYEKLILKFPEKSAYFATRIENLRNNIK